MLHLGVANSPQTLSQSSDAAKPIANRETTSDTTIENSMSASCSPFPYVNEGGGDD